MQEFLQGVAAFAAYVLPVAGFMFVARAFVKIPDELFRKILHFILLGAYFPFLYGFETWWLSVLLALLIVAVAYPIFVLLGRLETFSSFVNERKRGEFKSSLILAMLVEAASVTICWGIFDDRLLALACVYAWGVGDGMAALVGKQFGKHKISLPYADPKKSWEGSGTMFLCSLISVLVILLVRGGLDLWICLLTAVLAATATTIVELYTKGGWDTVTCPMAAMLVILPMTQLLGG